MQQPHQTFEIENKDAADVLVWIRAQNIEIKFALKPIQIRQLRDRVNERDLLNAAKRSGMPLNHVIESARQRLELIAGTDYDRFGFPARSNTLREASQFAEWSDRAPDEQNRKRQDHNEQESQK